MEYLAVVLLIAAIAAAFVGSGLGGTVMRYTDAAVCRVAHNGGLSVSCEGPRPSPSPVPTGSPTAGPTANPTVGPTGNPTSTPKPGPPVVPVDRRPVNACYANIGAGYGELTVTFPIRWVDIRGGVRLGFQKRKIVTPGKPDRWEVQVYGWGEAAIATPSLPGGQSGADDPAGPSQVGLQDPLGGGAWVGVNGTASQTYSFGSQKEADGFPLRYAEARARQLGNHVAQGLPGVGPALGLAEHLPWLGQKIKHLIEGDPLPRAKAWSIEAGPTGGFSGKLSLFNSTLGLSVGGRAWHLMGMSRDDQGNTTFSLKDSAEIEPSVIIDLGLLLPKKVRDGFNGKVDDAINYIERELGKRYGATFKLPAKARESLKANWPDIGITWKGKISVVYQLTYDKHGKPIKYSRVVDMQGNWYGRGAFEVEKKDKTLKAVGNIQVPLGGDRSLETDSLDLTDPANAKAAQDFFGLAAAFWVASPLGGVGIWGTPIGDQMNSLIDQKGTKTRLEYNSDVGNFKLTGQGLSSKGASLAELKLESENDQLSQALIWDDNRKEWVPWTACHR